MPSVICADSKTRLERRAEKFNLTPREIQVVARLSAGDTRKAVAFGLEISPWTVDFHLFNARRKIGAANLANTIVKLLT